LSVMATCAAAFAGDDLFAGDKSRLEGAPGYDSDFKWTPNYGREVDSYYSVRR
jgi:hypothetical protein